MFYNNVQIIGNLTADPELKTIPSGDSVATFSIAVNESYKNKQGQKVESVEFVNCVAWRKTGEVIAQWVKKGHCLMITGKLKTRVWEKDGIKHYRTEVIVREFVFGNNKPLATQAPAYQQPTPIQVSTPQPAPTYQQPAYQQPTATPSPSMEIPLPTPPAEGEISVNDIPF